MIPYIPRLIILACSVESISDEWVKNVETVKGSIHSHLLGTNALNSLKYTWKTSATHLILIIEWCEFEKPEEIQKTS